MQNGMFNKEPQMTQMAQIFLRQRIERITRIDCTENNSFHSINSWSKLT